MGQTRQDDTRTELSRPREPGLTTRMVEKSIQQHAPSVTPTHDTHHLFNCTHIRTTLSPLELWTDLQRDGAAGQMDGEAGKSDPPPPTSKGHGSG